MHIVYHGDIWTITSPCGESKMSHFLRVAVHESDLNNLEVMTLHPLKKSIA